MINDIAVRIMLEKADPYPFCFGGCGMLVLWKVAEIDDEVFASAIYATTVGAVEVLYNCSIYNSDGLDFVYNEIVGDFVSCNSDAWMDRVDNGTFEVFGNKDDLGLNEVLSVFHKKYSDFLNDVMYWFSIQIEAERDVKQMTEDELENEEHADDEYFANEFLFDGDIDIDDMFDEDDEDEDEDGDEDGDDEYL